jgi:hypothetical protein
MYSISVVPVEDGHYLAQPRRDNRLKYGDFIGLVMYAKRNLTAKAIFIETQKVWCMQEPKEEIKPPSDAQYEKAKAYQAITFCPLLNRAGIVNGQLLRVIVALIVGAQVHE